MSYRILLVMVVLLGVDSVSTAKPKQKPQSDDAFATIMSTKFDFGETGIDGTMKAPDGFFLQGKQNMSLSQMVRLRSSFQRELRNSRAGVRALTR